MDLATRYFKMIAFLMSEQRPAILIDDAAHGALVVMLHRRV